MTLCSFNLSQALFRRFERFSSSEDLELSLEGKFCNSSYPGNSHIIPLSLDLVSKALAARSRMKDSPEDLDQAIEIGKRAVHLCPVTDSRICGIIDGLGTTILTRFERTGNLTDLTEAIDHYLAALSRHETNPQVAFIHALLCHAYRLRSDRPAQLTILTAQLLEVHWRRN